MNKSEVRTHKRLTVRILTTLGVIVAAARLGAGTFLSQFATDPLAAGWQIHGDTNLFVWDATHENLRVTWDSAQSNSYFHRSLGTTLTRTNGFLLAFDLNLTDVPDTNGFQLAIGLVNLADATRTNFFRGSGFESPNLAEFDFYPDSGFGASPTATMADGFSTFTFTYVTAPFDLGTTYRIVLTHPPGAQTLTAQVLTNGQLYTTLPEAYISPGFGDYQLDTLAVCSYSDENGYGSSILAHGTVDNFLFTSPLPVETITPLAPGTVSFASDTHWVYTLETATALPNWSAAAPPTPGNGTNLVLQATNNPAAAACFRVRADRP